MEFQVFLTGDAAQYLEDLHDYVNRHDAPGKAEYLLNQIECILNRLAENPHRGVHPRELVAIGIREFREVFFQTLPDYLPNQQRSHLYSFDC